MNVDVKKICEAYEKTRSDVYEGDLDWKHSTFEGCPREVTGYFDCSHNELTSLVGGPEIVGESFYCSGNKLTSLVGAPERVSGDYFCSHNRLTSLEGLPEFIGRDLYCFDNPNLTIQSLQDVMVTFRVRGKIYFETPWDPLNKIDLIPGLRQLSNIYKARAKEEGPQV